MQSPRRVARPRRKPLERKRKELVGRGKRERERVRDEKSSVARAARCTIGVPPPLLAETRRMAIFLITMLIVVITAPYYGNEM